MIYGLYSMRDAKTGFMAPQCEPNDQAAIRNFHHAVLNSDQSLLKSHPQDFSLYLVGKFDSDSGIIDLVVPLVHLAEATDVFTKEVSG